MSNASALAPPHPGLSFISFVVMMASLQAMAAMAVDAMLPNLPAISTTFQLQHDNQRQLVIGSYLLGYGIAPIFYGSLSDRFGRKRVLLFGCCLYVLFSSLAAFSPTFSLLLAARALQGIGAGASRVVPNAIIRDCYVGRQMAKVMSSTSIVFMAAPMLAPSMGQAISLFASWRWVFGALSLFGTVVGLWVAFKLPETLHPEYRTPIHAKRMAHSFGVALRSRQGMGYAMAITFMMGAVFGFVNSVQQIFQEVFQASALFPAAFALMAGAMSLSSLTNAWLVERVGMRPLAHRALIVFIVISALHAAVALSGHETILTFALLQAAVMLVFGLMIGNFAAMAMEPLGHIAGAAASLQGSLATLGGGLIGFLIGQQFDHTTAPIAVGYLLLSVLALAAVWYAEKGKLLQTRHRTPGSSELTAPHG